MKNIKTWKWGRIFLGLLVVSVIYSTVLGFYANKVYADTTGWVDTSIDSKDTAQIVTNLGKARDGLNKWDATSGNAYILTATPQSDMAEVIKNLDSYIARAESLNKLDKNSKEYQDGLTDLNDSVFYLNLYADEYWMRHQALIPFLVSQVIDFALLLSFVLMIAYHFVNSRQQPAVSTKK